MITDTSYSALLIDGQGNLTTARKLAENIALSLTDSNHIDSITPAKDKKSISIDQSRGLRSRISLKSKADEIRVVIIDHIGLMGSEAQNALLKTIEELGEGIVIIIIAITADDALPTIRSRCRIEYAGGDLANKDSDTRQWHIDNAMYGQRSDTKITSEEIRTAVSFMKKSISDRLHDNKNLTENRDEVITLLQALHILCISTMRQANSHEARLSWSQKVSTTRDLLNCADSNTSAKLLLLGAATRL